MAEVYNKCLVGADSQTAKQRVKGGKPYRGEFLPSGCRVQFRTAGKVKGGVVSSRWFDGIGSARGFPLTSIWWPAWPTEWYIGRMT